MSIKSLSTRSLLTILGEVRDDEQHYTELIPQLSHKPTKGLYEARLKGRRAMDTLICQELKERKVPEHKFSNSN